MLDATALGGLVAEGLARAVPPMASDDEIASIVLRTLCETDGRQPAESRPELERLRASWPAIARQLELAYRELQAVDALKDDFLASMSHELLTPLTSIGGFAEILATTFDLDNRLRDREPSTWLIPAGGNRSSRRRVSTRTAGLRVSWLLSSIAGKTGV